MENNERELGKIQQQLDSTIENIAILRNNITTLFNKLDSDSKDTIKEIAKIYESINIHLNQLSSKIENNSKETVQEISKIYTSLNAHLNSTKEKRENCERIFNSFETRLNKQEIKIDDIDTNQQRLDTNIDVSLKAVKVFVSIISFIALLISIASMVITFLKLIHN
jgi:chromosome segregation ATPase